MAALLLLDSLSRIHPPESALVPLHFPRPSRSLPDPGLSGHREAKLFLDRCFDVPAVDPSWQSSLTCRCTVSPLLDGLDPLPRVSNRFGGSRIDAMAMRDSLMSTAAADMHHPSLFSDNEAAVQTSLIDSISSNAQQPSSSGNQDGSKNALATDRRQELDLRRRRYSTNPSYLSVSQSARKRRQTIRNGATIQLADRASETVKGVHGPTGVYMSFAVLILGITAVLQQGLLGVTNSPTAICSNCDGYGVEPCDICGARGTIVWEGKLTRADPCPLCFGSCTRKCRSCGGIRVKKGLPPIVQQLAQKSMRRN